MRSPLIAAAALLSLACAADIPAISDAELEQALSLAGANRAQLEQALFACQQKPFTMAAMRFLIVSLPLVDLGVISTRQLEENVDLAMQARAEFAYCQELRRRGVGALRAAAARQPGAAAALAAVLPRASCATWCRLPDAGARRRAGQRLVRHARDVQADAVAATRARWRR